MGGGREQGRGERRLGRGSLLLLQRPPADRSDVDRVVASWKGSAAEARLHAELDEAGVPSASPARPAPVAVPGNPWTTFNYKTGQLSAMLALCRRGFLNSFRNPAVIWLRFAM